MYGFGPRRLSLMVHSTYPTLWVGAAPLMVLLQNHREAVVEVAMQEAAAQEAAPVGCKV